MKKSKRLSMMLLMNLVKKSIHSFNTNLDGSFIRISKLILIFIATIRSEVDLTFPYQVLLETRKLVSTSRITMTNVSYGLFLQVNIPKEKILDGKVYILIMQKSSRAGIESIP